MFDSGDLLQHLQIGFGFGCALFRVYMNELCRSVASY